MRWLTHTFILAIVDIAFANYFAMLSAVILLHSLLVVNVTYFRIYWKMTYERVGD